MNSRVDLLDVDRLFLQLLVQTVALNYRLLRLRNADLLFAVVEHAVVLAHEGVT